MSFLRAIEPFLLMPPEDGDPCVDRGSDSDRRDCAVGRQARGLRGLIAHPGTPETVLEGIKSGVYAPVGGKGVFLHREDYLINGTVFKTRWSVVLGIDLSSCPLAAVTATPRDAVDVTTDHLRVAGVDPGGVTALYRDEDHFLEKLVAARGEADPLVRIDNPDGGGNSIWLLSPEEGRAVIHLLESRGATLVGDIALYRAISRLRDDKTFAGSSLPIVNFYNQRDFGVTLSACARVHPLPAGFDVNAFVATLHSGYEVTEFRIDKSRPSEQACSEFFDSVRTEGITQKVAGVLIGGVDTAFMVRVPESASPPGLNHEVPDPVMEYDVEWVCRGIIERLLPPDSSAPMHVLMDPRAVPRYLAADRKAVALILNPPPKRHIPELATHNWRLPFGSLQIKPAVPRGLFLAPF